MSFDPSQPDDDLPLLPPQVDLDTHAPHRTAPARRPTDSGHETLPKASGTPCPPSKPAPPIIEWIKSLALPAEIVQIPEGKPHALGASDMFHPAAVIFKGDKDTHQVEYASPEQAALAAELAAIGVRGGVEIPKSPTDSKRCLRDLQARIAAAHERFTETAAQRTGTHSLQEKTATLLMHLFIHGRSP